MIERLEGKVAVVTGGASGIGRAMGERFARDGMRVVLADVEAPALDATVAALRDQGLDVAGVVTDVSDFASVEALRDAALDAHGAVHAVQQRRGGRRGRGADVGPHDQRLALGAGGERVGRHPRHQGVRPRHGRRGRGGPRGQHPRATAASPCCRARPSTRSPSRRSSRSASRCTPSSPRWVPGWGRRCCSRDRTCCAPGCSSRGATARPPAPTPRPAGRRPPRSSRSRSAWPMPASISCTPRSRRWPTGGRGGRRGRLLDPAALGRRGRQDPPCRLDARPFRPT